MRYVDDASDTLTEVFWSDVTAKSLPTPAVSPAPAGKLARFFESLAASMRLHRQHRGVSYGRQPVLTASDIVAQNYPHLYIQVMLGQP